MTEVQAYHWDEMERESLFGSHAERVAMRGDHSLVTINWIAPGTPNRLPHSHPFDQIIIIAQGSCDLVVDGVAHPMADGAMLRVPANVPHTMHMKGDRPVLNIDVFAPARGDYLYLTDYQKFISTEPSEFGPRSEEDE